MDVNETIKSRREELGLSDLEVARASGLTIHSYCDIELYPDELVKLFRWELVPLGAANRLCSELRLNLLDLLDVHCAFCRLKTEFEREYFFARNELIQRQREKHGWSTDELGRRVNYRGVEIDELETSPIHIENWRIGDVKRLAAVIDHFRSC